MEVNYWLIGLVVILVVALMTWLLRRNNKDEEDFEREVLGRDRRRNVSDR